MGLIATIAKEEGGQHVYGWENITLEEKETAAELIENDLTV